MKLHRSLRCAPFARVLRCPRRQRAPVVLRTLALLALLAWPFVLTPLALAQVAAQPASDDIRSVALPPVQPVSFNGDVRQLPQAIASQRLHSWNEFEEPPSLKKPPARTPSAVVAPNVASAPMPAPAQSFDGISFNGSVGGGQAGAGWPPDVNGDVGPNHFIEAVNDAWVIYSKSGTKLSAFTENALWSGAGTGTPCDANNQGDAVVLHDGLVDRWILTNFAFAVSGSNPVAPFYQCFAISKTGDPVAGGWYLYAVRMDPGGTGLPPIGTLNDYPKFGLWSDCLYMAANEFTASSGNFAGTAAASFSRADLYAGRALTGAISMLANTSDPFTMIPSNLLGASAASLPPAGTPNYFVSESQSVFAFEVRKFTAGANCGAGGTLGAPINVSQASYTPAGQYIVPQSGTSNKLDSLPDRLMQKVQYRKLGNAESLWVVHSVQASGISTVRPQWAQINVSGKIVAVTPVQQQIYAPDTSVHRWMPSLAVDRLGNMALGYSTSNSSTFPSIAYSGRLVSDPLNNLSQTETRLVAGAGSQTNNCGSAPCHRWGDYTAMSLDPSDDCTFWYVNQYYSSIANGANGNWQTRIGSFKFSGCTAVAATYTVTPSVSGGNGSTSPSSAVVVKSASTTTFTLTPNSGYHIATVAGTCGGTLAISVYTTNAITANCTVIASFAINTYVVTPSVNGGNGSITPSTAQTTNYGAKATFTLAPNNGYHAIVGGTCGGTLAGNTYTTNAVTANCSVVASFSNTYIVTPVVSGGNGNLAPATPQTIVNGATTSFGVTANAGYAIGSTGGCGGSRVGSVFTTAAIHADCTVTATFNPPSQIAISGGNTQFARVGTAFATALGVRVADISNTPIVGAIVHFSANAAVNGATASLSASAAVSDANGIARVTATANALAGGYSVSASVTGVAAGVEFVLTNQDATALSIGIDDNQIYAGYGRVLNYIVTVHNAGPATASDISVSNIFPSQLDITQAQWTCLGGPGTHCTASGSGALSDSDVIVPANASLSWTLSAPVLANAAGETVDNAVALSSTADTTPADNSFADHDVLVLFRSSFESGDDGVNTTLSWAPPLLAPLVQQLDANNAVTLQVPAQTGYANIATLLAGHGSFGSFRIESMGFLGNIRVRLIIGGTEERATAWAPVALGAVLDVRLVATPAGWALRVDGAADSIQLDIGVDAVMQPVYRLDGSDSAAR